MKPANLDRPSWQWSPRDWWIFRSTHCGQTPRARRLSIDIVSAARSGTPIAEIAAKGEISRSYVNMILAAERLRDEVKMKRFYDRRGNLGRPFDMGGPRDEWLDRDLTEGKSPMASELVEIEGELTKPFETEKAWCFSDGKTESWLPKSQVEWHPSGSNRSGTMVMPEWMADERGFS